MDTKKFVLIIIFSTSLLFLWDAWVTERGRLDKLASESVSTAAGSTPQQGHEALPVPGDALTASQAENGQAAGIDGAPTTVTPRMLATGEQIKVVTDMVIAEIDTAGGDLRRLELLKHPSSEDKEIPYALLQSQSRIAVAQAGLIGDGLPNHKTEFTLDSSTRNFELTSDQDKIVVRLLAPEVNGVQVAKIYTFHRGSYVIDVQFEVQNHGEAMIRPFAYFQMLRDNVAPPGSTMMIPTYLGAAIYTEDEKFQKIHFSDLDKNKADYPQNADNGWIAMLEHYFVSAWLPEQGKPREFFAKRIGDNLYTAGIIVPVGGISPGDTARVTMPLYAGPQEQDKLAELSPGLELTVDYGWLTVIAAPLFWLLSFYHEWVGNWGVAIILLTMTVKLLFFPLSAAGYRSMAKLRLVTPKLQRIQEQYKSDRPRMHQAMMELYKEEKINPMGGCLPILVQIPVFIALFWTLLAAVELRYAPFALWITDLSSPDPYYVLPVLMGISMFIQFKLNPKPTDPLQARVMQIMPIAFSIFFFFFPAGLVLYSLVNNILSILQQWQITRLYGQPAEEKGSKVKPKEKAKEKRKS
ncbi:protein translocase subunit yidC [Nitrosomonas nitrosa]|jgi:YidC/Oxa1 family membrane protein insertase|uniref:Membrane protein insertase YidC n=3 Tax=Nitrosomonas nitrosa TaxID=52442 RepID=A0A1I4R541_9PROT|nr:membrane protein insertase YidC [Nitrosomonas nitrosa]PTR00171.1 protein translocase subunit yidC [Nitrosomonas nitrosa]CAE6509138.1 Membrane protein insertase YidC [Nitrosomonas nitrosa]SFM47428.1 protein translocase subunit yidC [Nitrosomonas nitrosa]HNP50813.1 membrane protein insertase YidC [Nitrosomonas nitrosa]